MSDPRLPRALHVDPIFPNNGVPARPGEDRPGLSPFGRLAMGGALGKSSILIYDRNRNGVQDARVDMINIQGDDLDAQQLIVTLHPPRVLPLSRLQVSERLDVQNLTGEQTNSEVTAGDFPGMCGTVQWPPLEALVEFGVGGCNMKVVADYVNGVTLSVTASFLRVSALVTQSEDCGEISGTSAAYYLASHVGPGFAETHAQRTIYAGCLDNCRESGAIDLPRMAKVASLVGHTTHSSPVLTRGWIRFWQSPDGTNGVGDFFVADHQCRIDVPNGAQYFSVMNESGHAMKMSVIFKLAL